MPDYGEIMCQAIDQIVTQKLQGLQYDITKVCTIVDDSERDKGKYVVSDGAARYEAYSTTINYREGNSVYVLIPNGDFNLQKTILGKYVEVNTEPFVYTPPLDTMIEVELQDFTFSEGTGCLLANSDHKNSDPETHVPELHLCGKVGDIEGDTPLFNGYDRLGLSANFQAWLAPMDTFEGSYGLKIHLKTKEPGTIGGEASTTIYELTFSNADMYGNTYNFETAFAQEKVFNIGDIRNIYEIAVYAFQNGEFKDGNGNYIPHTDSLGNLLQDNIFISDLKFYLGYSSQDFTTDTLILYTGSGITYSNKLANANANKKVIELRWVHQQEDGSFKLVRLEDLTAEGSNLSVKWYRYKLGEPAADAYSGVYWTEVNNGPDANPLLYTLDPDILLRQEEIKAIGFITTEGGVDEEGNPTEIIVPYYSNLLTFTNEGEVVSQQTVDVTTALSIEFQDNSFGNYFIYDQNGKLIDTSEGAQNERQLKVLYKGAELTADSAVQSITWEIPIDSSMIVLLEEYYKDARYEQIKWYKTNDYMKITRNFDFGETPNTLQSYQIRNFWSSNYSSNTVRCSVMIDNVTYFATQELRFGKAGTTGTDVTFLIDFENNVSCLNFSGTSGSEEQLNDNSGELLFDKDEQPLYTTNYVGGGEAIVRAYLYDSAGRPINMDDYKSKIKWTWKEAPSTENPYLNKIDQDDKSCVKISVNKAALGDQVPKDNYFILQATLEGWGDNNLSLISYLPIPIRKNNDYAFIEGCKEVIYDSQGIPNYYKGVYKVYNGNGEAYRNEQQQSAGEKVTWGISVPENEENSLYLPKLKTVVNQGQALSVLNFYVADANKNVCVYAIFNDEVVWSQPILITQNRYDFSMLNSWDGTLSIDEDNGTILSTMVGAGRKNSDNTFSGVLMGDLLRGTGNQMVQQTGLFGFSGGIMSYGFKEDGTAFIGKSTEGQIIFDGNKSIIQSKGYTNKPPLDEHGQPKSPPFGMGMKIDLNEGSIDAYNFKLTSNMVRISSTLAGPYLQVRNPDKENFGSDDLLQISDTNFKLQSKDGNNVFNVADGILSVNGYGEIDGAKQKLGSVTIQPKSPFFEIKGADDKVLMSVGDTQNEKAPYYLKSSNYKQATISGDERTGGAGLEINLSTGIITGYNLYLSGYNAKQSEYAAVFDTSAETGTQTSYPLSIGKLEEDSETKIKARPFRVDWYGNLYCTDVKIGDQISLKAVAEQGEHLVDITENFYVTPGGGVGGSSGTFTGGVSASGFTGGSFNGWQFSSQYNNITAPNGFAFTWGKDYIWLNGGHMFIMDGTDFQVNNRGTMTYAGVSASNAIQNLQWLAENRAKLEDLI